MTTGMLTHRYTFLLAQIVLLMLVAGTLAYAAADWRKQKPVRGPGGAIVATAVTPDGSRAGTVTADGHISLWDLTNRKLIRTTQLPDGKPIHLAIRNQGDAIAVAHENSDAVIWWCDGSNKVVRPSVDARLVAFAHQKRLLATVSQSSEFGASWDIDTATQVGDSSWTGTKLPMTYLTVLPSDNGAIVHETSLVGNSRGFGLEGEIEVYPSSTSGTWSSSEDEFLTAKDRIVVQRFDGTGMWFTGIPRGGGTQVFNEQGSPTTRHPVCLYDLSYRTGQSQGFMSVGGSIVAMHLDPAHSYWPMIAKDGSFDGLVTGNSTGDLIIYRRSQANDWIKRPAAWLVLPGFFLLGLVMLKRRGHRLEHPAPAIDPVDASLDLPRQTIVAAWIMVIIGVLAVGDMVYGLFVNGFTLRIDALAILAGIRIRQRRNGWRKFAAFIAWLTMAGGALMLGATLIGQHLLEFSVGTHVQFLPIWLGSLFSFAILGLGIFLFLALTHPQAQQICAAANSPDITRRDQRIAGLIRCPSCKYNTTQTVLDGLHDCPECGMHIRYSPTEQGWVREHRERKN